MRLRHESAQQWASYIHCVHLMHNPDQRRTRQVHLLAQQCVHGLQDTMSSCCPVTRGGSQKKSCMVSRILESKPRLHLTSYSSEIFSRSFRMSQASGSCIPRPILHYSLRSPDHWDLSGACMPSSYQRDFCWVRSLPHLEETPGPRFLGDIAVRVQPDHARAMPTQ